MDKLKMHTPNKADENFKKLAELFPNAVTETIVDGEVVRAIDKDTLTQEISTTVVEGKEERYQFTWPDKKKAMLLANAPISKTLRPCREESVDFDNTENLYIEGDNLDILKLLQETYLGKVKMIYIDPPYNTGNDFVYEDDFAQSTDEYMKNSGHYDVEGNRLFRNMDSNGRFHTNWLNMIFPRLRVAKDLLTDDGVIFISIDDNEIDNMGKVCDEIFGQTNHVSTIGLEITKTQGMKVKAAKEGAIVKNYEYILCYRKNSVNKKIVKNILFDKNIGYDTHFSYYITKDNDQFIVKKLVDVLKENKEIFMEFNKYGLVKNEKIGIGAIEKGIDLSEKIKRFIYVDSSKYIFQEMACNININSVLEDKLNKSDIVEYQNYLLTKSRGGKLRQYGCLGETLNYNDEYISEYGRVTIRGNLWKGFYSDMMNVAKEGNVEYKNGKKPVRLISQLAKWIGIESGDIVLDFFSGSATTAHAIMKLNSEDYKKRKYIMVQINEDLDESLLKATGENKKNIHNTIKFLDNKHRPHILSELGKVRIVELGNKLKEDKDEFEKLDTGFRVLKLDSTNMKDIYYNPQDIGINIFDKLEDNIKEDRTPEDLLFQVMLDLGINLSSKIEEKDIDGKKVFNVADNYLIACFDKNVSEKTIEAIAKKKPYYFVMRDNSMANDNVATNFEQIFKTFSPTTVRKVL